MEGCGEKVKKIDVASLEGGRAEITEVLKGCRYCEFHGKRILQDAMLDKSGDVAVGAAKVKDFAHECSTELLVCIRSFGRPAVYTLKTMLKLRTDCLVFITAEDRKLSDYMVLYASAPEKFVLGPKGGDNIVAFMRECCQKAQVKSFLTLDDNIEKLDFCTQGKYKPLTITMWHDLLAAGSKLLRKQPFFSVAAYNNPDYQYEDCTKLGPH